MWYGRPAWPHDRGARHLVGRSFFETLRHRRSVRLARRSGFGTSMSAPAWYVIETQRHREPVARAVLSERGIVSYLPFVEHWPRPAVGAAVGPMFPGYLFVHAALEEQAHRIMRTNGVKSFVCFGGGPVPLTE